MTSRGAQRRHSRPPAVPLLAAVALAGCLHGEDPPRGAAGKDRAAPSPSGPVTVARGPAPEVAYVAGNRAYGLRDRRGSVQLGSAVDATLVATLSPAAALDPSRRRLAYNAWARGGPAIRVHEPGSGRDRVLDAGAYSLAWRADGAIAYVKTVRRRLDPRRERPRGHVVVRRDPAAPPVRWTERSRHYVVAAWARDHLLAYRVPTAKGRWPDLLAFDGPGPARVLARRSGLVALSPDGRRALVTTYGASPPLVRVVSVEQGAEEAQLRLGDGSRWITESGSWAGSLVTAKADAGLVVLRVGASRIGVEQVLRIDRAAYPLGVFEPQADAGEERIVAWAQRAQEPRSPLPRATVLSCHRLELRCVEGADVATAGELRFIIDPSRP
jgi:hypothetical protein